MIQTETSKAKIIFVSVPNDAQAFNIERVQERCGLGDLIVEYNNPFTAKENDIIPLPQGNWTILNTLDDVTEGEANKVMPSYYCPINCETYFWHKEGDGTTMLEGAQTALKSLATSLGVEGKTIILYQLK